MEIYVLDKEINVLGVISTYTSIIWTTKFHEPGIFKATFVFTAKMNSILQLGNLLYKTDEEEPVIITRKFLTLNKRGEQAIQVQGYMASRYLNRRIIWKKMVMSGTPEQVMRKMVEEQVINPEDSRRKMERIRLGKLRGYGGYIKKQVTYDNLQEALTDISKTHEIGYRMRLDIGEKMFYFETFKGVDRTLGTQKPCIFTRDYGNIYTQEYSEDETNYRNVCLVGGTGEDENRILATVGEASGIGRYEMFYNASSLSNKEVESTEYINQLKQKGKEKMASYYVAKAFESKINQRKAMAFSLGDYVTCTDSVWNVAVNTQIKEIEKGFSKNEESFVVTFGDDVPTLIDLIRAKE
ncbi:MAG: siphovirus ReqiPepy6 Gp37-like family protein [Lachnospiraceae bacterium]